MDFSTEIKMNILVESLIQTAKKEILADPNFFNELANNENFVSILKAKFYL